MSGKAKKSFKPSPAHKGIYAFPSQFGSHRSMIDDSITPENPQLVACKDEFGTYITEISRLDNGLADPNRYQHRSFTHSD